MSLVNVGVRVLFSLSFEGGMWDLIVLVPDRGKGKIIMEEELPLKEFPFILIVIDI